MFTPFGDAIKIYKSKVFCVAQEAAEYKKIYSLDMVLILIVEENFANKKYKKENSFSIHNKVFRFLL